jgi:hypothetical protein
MRHSASLQMQYIHPMFLTNQDLHLSYSTDPSNTSSYSYVSLSPNSIDLVVMRHTVYVMLVKVRKSTLGNTAICKFCKISFLSELTKPYLINRH